MAQDTETGTKKTEKETLVGRLQKKAESIQDRVKEYNDKYVTRTMEKGRETVKEYNEKYFNKVFEKGRGYVDRPYKKVSKTFDDLLSKGRSMEKDVWKRIDTYVEDGRKFMYRIPMVESLEKRVSNGLQGVPAIINLPGKQDIEKLTRAMESLNSNIESLKKQAQA